MNFRLLRFVVIALVLCVTHAARADQLMHIMESGQPRTFRFSESPNTNGRPPELHEAGKKHPIIRQFTPDILVRLRADADPKTVAAQVGAESFHAAPLGNDHYIFHAASAASVQQITSNLRNNFAVLTADPLLARQRVRKALPNDPLLPDEWHLINHGENGALAGIDLHLTNTWNTYRGQGVVIAIVDDGIDTTHPDLAAHIDPALGFDWNEHDSDPTAHPLRGDYHGTECAGLALAIGNNGIGVTGVAYEATLAGLRLISLATTDLTESEAIAFKNDQIHVKSNSWGPEDDGQTLEGPGPLALAALEEGARSGRGGKGEIYVWAAGNGLDVNDNANYDGYANSIYTIAIGAVSDQGLQTDYSEPGACVVVVTPGGSFGRPSITTTDLQGANGVNKTGEPGDYSDLDYTSTFVGTSASVPQAAGGVALLLNANPNLGWRDVQEILLRSAALVDSRDLDWDINGAGLHFNHKYGAGLMDIDAAVNLAQSWKNLGAWTNTVLAQTNLNFAIPDNTPVGVTREFDLSQSNLRVEHVTLTANISHPFRGDLTITLISPSGLESRLAEQHNDPGTNYVDWTFMSVRHWGESSQGIWKVRISDLKNGDTGTLDSLRLVIYGTSTGDANPLTIMSLAFSDLSAGNGNGAIEPGETISGSFLLQNESSVSVSGTAQLMSHAPGVTVLSGASPLTAAAGLQVQTPVSFHLAEDVPCGATILFDLVTDLASVRRTNTFRQKVGPPLPVWTLQTIDDDGFVGSYTSLAVDSSDRAHISYYDTINGDLKYAHQTTNGWAIETVDSGGDVGTYTSIALDPSDQPRISYHDETQHRLKYASWNSFAWEIETVPTTVNAGTYSSLKLKADGTPSIAFMDETNGDLLYATKTGSAWNIQTVDSTNKTGADISLALTTGDQPMISYRDATLNDLKFAERTGADWNIVTVDSDGSVGFTSSLRIGTDGQPRIAYRDSSNTALKFAQRSASGWNLEVADSSGAVGFDCSLVLDAVDRPHIAYRDLANNTLKYAAWNGAFWSVQTVDATGLVGAYTSIALDPQAQARISYRDNGNGALKFASLSSTECQVFVSATPVLVVTTQPAGIVLSWVGFPDATLETTANLSAPNLNWHPVLTPVSQGPTNSVALPIQEATGFYRLKRN